MTDPEPPDPGRSFPRGADAGAEVVTVPPLRAPAGPSPMGLAMAPSPIPLTPTETPYDPAPQRERLRGWLAGGLTVLLALVVLLAFISYWQLGADSRAVGQKQVKDIIELLQILFGPLATLVGTVIGFYFGGKRE